MTSVRWCRAPLSFELVSAEPEPLRRARVVFRPWMDASVGAPQRSWSIERASERSWLVRDPLQPRPTELPTVEAAVRTVEFLAVNGVRDSPEATTLHAALLARGDRGVAILGGPEAGKSTLAAALWQRGFSLLGDDVTVVDPGDARAWPAPRRVGLRFPSRGLLGDSLWDRIHRTPGCDVTTDGCVFHPDDVEARPRPSSVRLDALIFLGRGGAAAGPAQARPLAPAHALLAVLPYTNVIRRTDTGTAIRRLNPLTTQVPAYDLGRGPLNAMTTTVERILA